MSTPHPQNRPTQNQAKPAPQQAHSQPQTKTAAGKKPAEETIAWADLQALASSPKQSDRRRAEKILDVNPQVWQELGNLRIRAEQEISRYAMGGHKINSMSLNKYNVESANNLAPEDATPLERLCAEQVVIATQAINALTARAFHDMKELSMNKWQQSLNMAQRRVQTAMKSLETAKEIALKKGTKPLQLYRGLEKNTTVA